MAIYTPADGGKATTMEVYDFKGKGVAMAMYNIDEFIIGFAHSSSFKMAPSSSRSPHSSQKYIQELAG
ncbi:hypothetical protein BJ138DRAFT_1116553 [Hygrophoropsis aurantiaca]|uniref:Uncharacterized protein n=1 Tax=Hygrophoropsis aurantiaca TaxID=72124 RepID=A0ACB8A369_9AGAM|nr:hypothetical protein BJ138DRAFT_1116553 [Hygrophoropsis aurantiaca]